MATLGDLVLRALDGDTPEYKDVFLNGTSMFDLDFNELDPFANERVLHDIFPKCKNQKENGTDRVNKLVRFCKEKKYRIPWSYWDLVSGLWDVRYFERKSTNNMVPIRFNDDLWENLDNPDHSLLGPEARELISLGVPLPKRPSLETWRCAYWIFNKGVYTFAQRYPSASYAPSHKEVRKWLKRYRKFGQHGTNIDVTTTFCPYVQELISKGEKLPKLSKSSSYVDVIDWRVCMIEGKMSFCLTYGLDSIDDNLKKDPRYVQFAAKVIEYNTNMDNPDYLIPKDVLKVDGCASDTMSNMCCGWKVPPLPK